MQRFEIVINLEHIKEMREEMHAAAREFGLRVDKAMKRLIHEAAAQRMSAQEVGKYAGMSTAQVKVRMKAMNLSPSTGKALLSKQAASVLESNAEIMGIEPSKIDLMSPLAYLPAGPLLKHETAEVTEFPETALTIREAIQNGIDESSVDSLVTNVAAERLLNDIMAAVGDRWVQAQADEAGA